MRAVTKRVLSKIVFPEMMVAVCFLSGCSDGAGDSVGVVHAASTTQQPVPFQSDNHFLWVDQSNGVGTNLGFPMMGHTVPSIITGTNKIAFQRAVTESLWLSDNGVGHDQFLGMSPTTSPSIAAYNGGTVIAFQANTGSLWLDKNGVGFNQNFGMMPGTSPSVVVNYSNQVVVAFQSDHGELWLDTDGVGQNQHLGMKEGTSPSIVMLHNGSIVVAFQANTGHLWLSKDGVASDQNVVVKTGTSPSITKVAVPLSGPSDTPAVAFQEAAGNLWVQEGIVPPGQQSILANDQGLGMKYSASPLMQPLLGLWQASFEANTGNLWVDINGSASDQHLGMDTP